jgi:hypothetical protein
MPRKKKLPPKPAYTFTVISYEQFERIADSAANYDPTEIDGREVITCHVGDNCVAIWYNSKGIGSHCPNFVGCDVAYVEQDVNWPWPG